ncbi:MAG: lysophospholipid acyltransferase family protein [Hyphomicrobiaceae bacterium]|nr:lysophospholipid acyltransferase family protein [Hyphomicrobiaceae bacterium]
MTDVTRPGPRAFAFHGAFYLVTGLMMLLGIWLLLGPRRWAMQALKLHARISLWLLQVICGIRMEVRGREHIPKGPCLIVAKHQSAWDTFALIPLFRDPAIVLKAELARIPLYGWFCVKFEHILVKRDRAAAALKSMIAEAKAKASSGREILIFAEGTRREPGAPPDYKPGYVALYEALALPAVPLALNSGLYWPRNSTSLHRGTIVVEILAPVPPGLPRPEARRRIEAAIEDASRRLIVEAAQEENAPPRARQLTTIVVG